MNNIGVVFVHGVSGSYTDLQPLELQFKQNGYNTLNIELPNHDADSDDIAFNCETFQNHILEKITNFNSKIERYIVIGHSTGGTLLLSILNQLNNQPLLSVMLASPFKVDMTYVERWDNSTQDKDTRMCMDSIAQLIALINQQSRKKELPQINTLIFHAHDDELVPFTDSEKWLQKFVTCNSKLFSLHDGNHHFIARHTNYIFERIDNELKNAELQNIDPELLSQLNNNQAILNNLYNSPSIQRTLKQELNLTHYTANKPVFANIEITTRCNLKCSFCAREHVDFQEQDMSLAEFEEILSKITEVYKVRIVGLGEPLLHKQIADFIVCAKRHNKHIGIVTNAQLLSADIGSKLIQAGLDEITFSIDSTDQEIAQIIRSGSNIAKIIENIKAFLALEGSEKLRTAVFTAISKLSLPSLTATIEDISKLDIQAIVLSDLNFENNINHSISHNMANETYEILKSAILTAYRNGKPVINSRAIEEFGIEDRIRDFLIKTPEQIFEKSHKHTWCLSPWQTLPILVNGDITLCDCQPETRAGNILRDNIDTIWNGEKYQAQRSCMLTDTTPLACKCCPRL